FITLLIAARSLDSVQTATRAADESNRRTLQLERLVVDMETGVRGYMLTHDRSFLAPYQQARGVIDERTAELVQLAPAARRPLAQRLRTAVLDYATSYTDPIVSGAVTDDPQKLLAVSTEGKRRLDGLRARFAQLSGAQERLIDARRAHQLSLRHTMLGIA